MASPLLRQGQAPQKLSRAKRRTVGTTQRLEALVVSIPVRQAVSDKCEGALGDWAPSKVRRLSDIIQMKRDEYGMMPQNMHTNINLLLNNL